MPPSLGGRPLPRRRRPGVVAKSVGGGKVCEKGGGAPRCVCPTGTTDCNGQCVDPNTFFNTNQDCGSCGNACSGGKTCQNGQCRCPNNCTGAQILNESTCTCECPPDTTLCWNGSCVSSNCTGGQTFDQYSCMCVDPYTCEDFTRDYGGCGEGGTCTESGGAILCCYPDYGCYNPFGSWGY